MYADEEISQEDYEAIMGASPAISDHQRSDKQLLL